MPTVVGLLVTALLLLTPTISSAQIGGSGSIQGTVVDTSSAAIPGDRDGDQCRDRYRHHQTDDGAMSTDILHFLARVLVIQAARDCQRAAPLIPDRVLPISLVRRAAPGSPDFASRRTGPLGSSWSEERSALAGHAAASTDGHLSHDADRLASPRVRRAAAARDIRSAGTASPVPKYISSGVCPRNAECGSTRLCSST